MKVAILFFGQPRFISNKLASRSHKFWFARKSNVDFYGHVWIPEANQALETQRLGNYVPNLNSVNQIKSQYPNIALLVDAPLLPEELFPNDWLVADATTDRRFLANTLSQLTSISRVLALVDRKATQYDLLVLTRWDNFIWWLPKLGNLNREKLNIATSLGLSNMAKYGIADLLLVGPFHLLKATNPIPLSQSFFEELKTEDATLWKWKSFEKNYSRKELNAQPFIVSMIRSSKLTSTLIKFPLTSLKNKVRIRVRFRKILNTFRLGNLIK